jgi:hypothetical protein
MSFREKQIITFQGNLFVVYRTFRDYPNFPTEEAKEYYMCDTTLRKDGLLYFCRKIEEAQVIEETRE